MSPDARLLLVTLAGVLTLVLLVARFRVNAFVALALVSLGVGIAAGMAPLDAAKAFQDGIGATLGLIVVVVGLGTMIGKMLAESGGASDIARLLVSSLGERRLDWAVLLAAFLVALPVFFAVGLVLLAPVLFSLARNSRMPMLRLLLPLLAGLSVCHTLVPPHPGPVVAVGRLGADMGRTILWGIAIGLPTAALVGPILGRLLARHLALPNGGLGAQMQPSQPVTRPPGAALSTFTILLPVGLMVLATIVASLPAPHSPQPIPAWRAWAAFAGAPLTAMLLAVLASWFTFGRRCGFHASQILKFMDDCVGPAASIFLVVGAGGGFSRVLDAAGVDEALARWGAGLALSPILLAWLVAAALRIAVGSATVAITMAASILAPVVDARPEIHRELLVIALGAGTLTLSHLNDGGFWFVKEYFGLSVPQTFKTWTVMVTLGSLVALALVLLANTLLHAP